MEHTEKDVSIKSPFLPTPSALPGLRDLCGSEDGKSIRVREDGGIAMIKAF